MPTSPHPVDDLTAVFAAIAPRRDLNIDFHEVLRRQVLA
jgi:hypothetical protein